MALRGISHDIEHYTHAEAHKEYKELLELFTSLAASTPHDLMDIWTETDHMVRRRVCEIRRDLCYSSHDAEAWEIVKYRVHDKLQDLDHAYRRARTALQHHDR